MEAIALAPLLADGDRAHWRRIRCGAVAGQRGLPVPERLVHPDAEGARSNSLLLHVDFDVLGVWTVEDSCMLSISRCPSAVPTG